MNLDQAQSAKAPLLILETIKKNKLTVFLVAAVLLIFLIYPFAVERILGRTPSRYYIRIGMDILFFTAMGNAWNIIGGYGRQTSWASATFFSIGAYTSILLYVGPPHGVSLQITPFISMWVGVALAIILAVIIGLPCFRLRGVYFAIATIACTTIFRQLLIYFGEFTGGILVSLSRFSRKTNLLILFLRIFCFAPIIISPLRGW